MRPEKPKRFEVNPQQPGLSGLDNAFSSVNLGPLPEPVAQPAPIAPVPVRRLGRVILRREKAHRGGKVVIVVHDFPPTVTVSELEELAKRLRRTLGTGGSVKDRTLEIQGDQAARVRALLEAAGFQVAGV